MSKTQEYIERIGLQVAPAIPATTVAMTSPFSFACLVQIQGGTVTVINVNGVVQGPTDGAFLVLTGETVTLTYSVAPTWRWYGLGGA